MSFKDEAFALDHHATMLGDRVRLEAYWQAIDRIVSSNMSVADIGSGSGILAAYAAQKTRGTVFAIEYFERAAQIAEQFCRAMGLTNVQVINSASYNHPVQNAIDCLVTETIGPLGPEENIVELCYEFLKRYPEISKIIPSSLSLYAQPIRSAAIETDYIRTLTPYLNAPRKASGGFLAIKKELEQSYSATIRVSELSLAKDVAPPQELTVYLLGTSARSDFSCSVAYPDSANAIHFWFDATLASGVHLSSHMRDPLTHWQHSFARIPEGKHFLNLSYSSLHKTFKLVWS